VSVQVEVRCPLCNGIELAPLGKAVTVSRGPAGVKDQEVGRTYGCLRCGANVCVTRTEAFAPNRALQAKSAPAPNGKPEAKGERVTKFGDRDLHMSPDSMA